MPELLFTIGPPRSGKSTYCTEWAKAAPNRAIVCGDSIRQALGFEYRQENETLVQGIKDTMIRALLDRGQDVIVDGTHSTEGNIKRIFQIDKKAKPVWVPHFHIYETKDIAGYECNPIELYNFHLDINERGRKTKGEYIIPVINRVINNTIVLAKKYGENLEGLRYV